MHQRARWGDHGLTRQDFSIVAGPSWSIRKLSYAYRRNSLLVERLDRFGVQYFMNSRCAHAKFSINDRMVRVSKNRVVFIPPDTDVIGQSTDIPEQHEILSCEFAADWLEEISGYDVDMGMMNWDCVSEFANGFVEMSMKKITECVQRPTPGTGRLLNAISDAVAIELATELFGRRKRSVAAARLSAGELANIRAALYDSGHVIPSTNILAAQLGITAGHLRRLYRRTTGSSLQEEIKKARLERACEMLVSTDRPLKQIAFLLGYRHHSTFSHAFSLQHGMSPNEMRSRSRS